MSDKYILEGKKAVPCNDLTTWGEMFKSRDRVVAKDYECYSTWEEAETGHKEMVARISADAQ